MVKHITACEECGSVKCTGCLKKYDTYKILKCDECSSEENTLYEFQGLQLCESCLIEKLIELGETVEITEGE